MKELIETCGATPKTYESIRIGAKFDQLVQNVRTLSIVKRKAGSNKPEVVLMFLMMKKNINELPSVVDLAHELMMDRIVATNLDCVVKPLDEELRVFSSSRPEKAFVEKIEEAKARAERYKIPFHAYPTEMRPTATCAADPLRNVFFTWDGMVAPCVYANMPIKQGFIPKIFCGKRHKIPVYLLGI
jgi:MoaA/NifB/PqqE/SkfB family radical SAM enzyme